MAGADDDTFERLRALKNGETVVTIGAGCSGLALLQEMVRLGERRTIVCVDRNDKVGGMWLTPYEGLGLHGPRKSVSHPSTYHLWKGLGVPEGQAKPPDLCRYFQAVQAFLEERGVRFLLGATVERVDDVLTVSKDGARAALDPIEYVIDARCSNIKVRPPHGFAKPLKQTPGGKDTLIIGSGKQGADVAIQRIRSLGDEITFASRVPIAFVAREHLTDPKKGLFAVLFRLSNMKTKADWLSCCEEMVEEGVLINPWEEATGNDGIEFHGGILSEGEVETLRQTKFARGEFQLTGEDSFCQEFGTVLRCTGAFREAAVRDEINDNERMKSMRFLYTPIASAQLFCAIGSHGINEHPINYALYPNRFAMMNQLMVELCMKNNPNFIEESLALSNPCDDDLKYSPETIKPITFTLADDAGVVVPEGGKLPQIKSESAVPPTVIVLPADDGSAQHWKALTLCLQSMGAKIVTVDIGEVKRHRTAGALADDVVQRTAGSEETILLGYAKGSLLVNCVAARFRNAGRELAGVVLFEPSYAVEELSAAAKVEKDTRMMASLVIPAADLEKHAFNWTALRAALLSEFPMLKGGFEGFELWRALTSTAADALEQSGVVSCPVTLIVSESDGRANACIKPWQGICPQAKVRMVSCDPKDIPFNLTALDMCMDFLLPHATVKARADARLLMKKTLEQLTSARVFFRKKWEQTHGKGSAFLVDIS